MSKLSVLIPSRNERFLPQTVADVLAKAAGDIEVIVTLDGYWPDPILPDDPRLKMIHFTDSRGMRNAINAAASVATGQYLLKLDAHCMVAEGFDEALKADCGDDWVVVPRRKRLDAANWQIQDVGKPDVDYMYLSFPDDPQDFGGKGLNGKIWKEKNTDPALHSVLIDDLMSAQGSGWFMHRDYFYFLELMDEASYGTFWNEFQEIGLKCWLSGGRVVVNKKTWYAHLHKGKTYGRGYPLPNEQLYIGSAYTWKWIYNEAWHKQALPFDWLIEKFSPVPGWGEDWKERLNYREWQRA